MDTDTAQQFFARDFFDASVRFDVAAGASIRYDHPHFGPPPLSDQLSTTVAWFGPTDARRVVVVVSGTHGVEGFVGSACQLDWMREARGRTLPEGIAVLLIHALNPWGMAWGRRTNEGNEDVNRNFLSDFGHLPENPAYRDLHDLLCPRVWPDMGADARLVEILGQADGARLIQNAVQPGQYEFHDGLFYGGTGPNWSNRTLRAIIGKMLRNAEQVVVLDFHTGLGPYAQAELICPELPDSPVLACARAWFGEAVKSPFAVGSVSAAVTGFMTCAFNEGVPGAQIVPVAVEFGTIPVAQTLARMRAENWHHLHGDRNSPEAVIAREQLLRAFYPVEPDWRQAVLTRGVEVIWQAVNSIAAA